MDILDRRKFMKALGLGAAGAVISGCASGVQQSRGKVDTERPNFVIIFTDDQGYGDVGCFGAKGFKTPNLDRMASEGVRFTDFYVASAACTPSRAALMTGCYPGRVSLPGVLSPKSKTGISDDEMTVAEVLKTRGYATACFGKWHLGHHKEFLPMRHGFDEYFGLPYSNDMRPHNPRRQRQGREPHPPLPLIDGEKAIEYDPDQSKLTTWYTERAVKFIEKNHDRPFFLYVPHTMPHVPLYVSDKFRGKSDQGLYGDVIMEIDWSVGQILSALKRNGLDENTLVIFSSDNGPWLSYGDHAGSAGPLREGKGTTMEGGQREPCIMRWTGRIPAGTECSEMATAMDILPTFAGLAKAKLPTNRIDGKDIWPLISGKLGAKSPHEAFYYYYYGNELHAVRSGKWKLHFPHRYRSMAGRVGGTGGKSTGYSGGETTLELYDLRKDIGETTNVVDKYPEVVKRLEALAEKVRGDLGDKLRNRKGKGIRQPGRVKT